MWQVARESTIQTFTRLLELGEIMWFTTTLIHSVSELLLSLRLTSTLSASCLLLVAYCLVLNLGLTRLLQCRLIWPNFPQWWHWQTDRLDSKCKPQSSSEIGSSLNHRQIIKNLMDFMCSCKDTTFFSRKEERIRLISSLLAHVLFWNWFVSFSHTVAETSGSPTKYNKDASWTDNTIIASVWSLRGRKFAYLSLSRAWSGFSARTINNVPQLFLHQSHLALYLPRWKIFPVQRNKSSLQLERDLCIT